RLAAANRSEADLAAMADEIALLADETLSDEDFCASDVRFHRAVVQATGNGPVQLMMHAMIESFIPITNMLIYRDHERRRTVAAHQHIRAAIAARDARTAAQLMRDHVEDMRTVLDQALARRNTNKRQGGTP